jgi:hypothetical protein
VAARADELEILAPTLGDQQAVERIAGVMPQRSHGRGMCNRFR